MNAPERWELFVLPDGVRKVSLLPDTKQPNTLNVTIRLEDHTLGNILARHLQSQAGVVYAGYRVPHPLEHRVELKVQTDGSVAPVGALQQTINRLIGDLSVLDEGLRTEIRRSVRRQ